MFFHDCVLQMKCSLGLITGRYMDWYGFCAGRYCFVRSVEEYLSACDGRFLCFESFLRLSDTLGTSILSYKISFLAFSYGCMDSLSFKHASFRDNRNPMVSVTCAFNCCWQRVWLIILLVPLSIQLLERGSQQ